ncbi:ABC transporter permease [Ancylobacter sonchi]|nr:ABC transporter permease [Ancylobacter sonchi]MBS7534267.1 ABC transporter permease [Ancylobacter sonchi]
MHVSFSARLRTGLLAGWTVLVLLFLVVPILIPVVLSFNSERFFLFPPSDFSLRWYQEVLGEERWRASIVNSLVVGFGATCLATVLGTMAALGLDAPAFPARRLARALIMSPVITPIVITAVGSYLFAAQVELINTYAGLILAHTILGAPFVVVTVSASLTGFDANLMRAASMCGAPPLHAFRRVMLPLILPGVLSGAAFAFVTSFDEVVIAQFLTGATHRTLPLQMFTGLREQLSPALAAAATFMMLLSLVLLGVTEILRRRTAQRVARARIPA